MSLQEKIPVYFVPGMAASSKIFERVVLPKDLYSCHYLEWNMPLEKESLASYVKRMCLDIYHDNPILIGVSFGGIIVQEMNKYIATRKTIVISSVLHHSEFPLRMKIAKRLKIYRLIPKRLLLDVNQIAKFAFGVTIKDRLELYKQFMYMNNGVYLRWALRTIINWKQTQDLKNVVLIHGSNDKVFPKRNIKHTFVEVKNGSHAMIVFRFRWFNEHLAQILK